MLDVIDLILGLLVGVAVLSALAKRIQVPPGIVLVIGGAPLTPCPAPCRFHEREEILEAILVA